MRDSRGFAESADEAVSRVPLSLRVPPRRVDFSADWNAITGFRGFVAGSSRKIGAFSIEIRAKHAGLGVAGRGRGRGKQPVLI